jgi:hypothetical protein
MSVLPAWIVGPFEDVLHDLQKPRAVGLSARWERSEDVGPHFGYLWVTETTSGWTIAVTVSLDSPAEDLKATLADALQDQFFPESTAAWGEARPACLGHRHPASVDVIDGVAIWCCPEDGRQLGRVGAL